MVDTETFRKTALSFPEASELPHFEKTSFRVNKKIFATLDSRINQACVKLSESDQNVFSAYDRSVIYPVPNKWGIQGWTFIDLKKVRKDIFVNALKAAYSNAAKKKLSTVKKQVGKHKTAKTH